MELQHPKIYARIFSLLPYATTFYTAIVHEHSLIQRVTDIFATRRKGIDWIFKTVSRFAEKQWVLNGVHSTSWEQLMSYLKEKIAAPV
jgi:hypothetical protein